jgi:hypothetical protein
MPMPDELVLPRVVSLKPAQDGNGRLVAEFTIEWNVGEPLAAASEAGSKYWTFVQVLGAGARTIVTRATLWPDPPTTAWKPATKQTVGPLRVPILPNMQGSYPVRVGLYCPETKSHPPVEGDAQRIVGTLTVDNDTGGGQTLSFRAQN